MGRRLGLLVLVLLLVVPLAACGSEAAGSKTSKVTLGLGFIPNIQFAPFYVADALGYYKDAGIQMSFHHHAIGEDLFGGVVAGKEDLIFAAGDEVLQARSRDVPLVYLAQVFNQYPVTLIVPADSPIKSPADLKGHSVGIPGKYGATYIGLLALLKSANLTEQDVDIQSIGFTQVEALVGHKVDSVVGYINNEPIQIQKAGMTVRTIPVASVQPLISNGLVALEKELSANPATVKAVIAATLRGVEYVNSHPEETVNLAKKYVPGLDDPANAADALAVLKATIPLFETSGKPGATDPTQWHSMADFLQAQGFLAKPVDVATVVSSAYLP